MLRSLAIVTVFVACTLSIGVRTAEASSPNNCAVADSVVRGYAMAYHVPPDFAAAVIAADIANGTLTREDAARYGLRYPVSRDASVRAIVQRLGFLLTEFYGNQALAAAAFNVGPASVKKYNGIPPYAGVRFFVGRVTHLQCSSAATPPQRAQTGITVVTATYGASCRQPTGNVTKTVKSACDGRSECNYSVDWHVLGDPAYGCKKDFSVQWICSNGGSYSAFAPAEAGYGSKVRLHC